MRQNDLLDWYESSLPARERKLKGHFSTPPRLVAQILDACNYTPDHDLSQIRVLDPACGSGNFVASAAQRLLAYGKRAGLSETAIAGLVSRNIWGFDPDPVACFLAEMQVHNAFLEQSTLALETENNVNSLAHKRKKSQNIGKVQIHQADGLAFPWWQGAQVDLLLANPPYLAAKNNDLSVYRSAQQRGQADSYLLFLELALQIVRPGGWLGLVLPDPVLARSNAARERKRLLAETTVHHLWHLADVFAAYVGAVIIVAQKRSPDSMHFITWRRARWSQDRFTGTDLSARTYTETQMSGSGSISQARLQRQAGVELRYLLSEMQGTLVEQIYTHLQNMQMTSMKGSRPQLIPLKDLVQIHRGEELSKESPVLSRQRSETADGGSETFYPVLRGGGDVRPYGIGSAHYWIRRDKIAKPLERYLVPKLLIVKSAGRLQATLDLHKHVVLQTLYTLSFDSSIPEETPMSNETCTRSSTFPTQHDLEPPFSIQDELYYLLALLNSRLLQEYVYVLHTAYKWVQPQIEQRVLAQLPIPVQVDRHEKSKIIQRARQIMSACSQAFSDVELKEQKQAWYEEQEQAICHLYQTATREKQVIQQEESPLDVLDEGVRYG